MTTVFDEIISVVSEMEILDSGFYLNDADNEIPNFYRTINVG